VDLPAYVREWSRLHGYDPSGNRFVQGWLRLSYAVGRPVAAAGISPHLVTALGVVAAAGAAVVADEGRPGLLVLAAGLVLGSAVLDGMDGAVAVLSGRATRVGALLDSAADRVSDLLLLAALWQAGADPYLCVLAGALTFLLEYVRARAGVAGLTDVGVVTVGERPTRVVVVVAGVLMTAALGAGWASPAAGAVAGLTAIGLVQFVGVAVRRLR
jgi:phosphatidylglycerophosphate synthase